MSKASDLINTLLFGCIAIFFFTIVLPILASIVGTMFAINTFTYTLLPKADLPRTSTGQFVVTEDNYKNWHTMARIETSKENSALLKGDYVVRVFPKITTTCQKIKNCNSYESQFVNVDYKNADVYFIKKENDSLFSQAVTALKSRIQAHNKQLKGNFDLDITFEDPYELDQLQEQFKFLEDMSTYTDLEKKVKKLHNKAINFAIKNCKNNGVGCDVNVTLIYDNSVFGGPDFLLER